MGLEPVPSAMIPYKYICTTWHINGVGNMSIPSIDIIRSSDKLFLKSYILTSYKSNAMICWGYTGPYFGPNIANHTIIQFLSSKYSGS